MDSKARCGAHTHKHVCMHARTQTHRRAHTHTQTCVCTQAVMKYCLPINHSLNCLSTISNVTAFCGVYVRMCFPQVSEASHSTLNKLLQSQHLEKEALKHESEPPSPVPSTLRDTAVERGAALDQLLSERGSVFTNREQQLAPPEPSHRLENRGYAFTPQGGPAWNRPDPSDTM